MDTRISLRQILREFFWDVKDFAMSPEVDTDVEETQLGSYDPYDALTSVPMLLRCFAIFL